MNGQYLDIDDEESIEAHLVSLLEAEGSEGAFARMFVEARKCDGLLSTTPNRLHVDQ
jgi:hypothetical protein